MEELLAFRELLPLSECQRQCLGVSRKFLRCDTELPDDRLMVVHRIKEFSLDVQSTRRKIVVPINVCSEMHRSIVENFRRKKENFENRLDM
jgi:hypothetical protein